MVRSKFVYRILVVHSKLIDIRNYVMQIFGPGRRFGMGILFGFWSDVRFQLVVVATQESQPAVQVATRAAASRLCRHSAQTHTPEKCVSPSVSRQWELLPKGSVVFSSFSRECLFFSFRPLRAKKKMRLYCIVFYIKFSQIDTTRPTHFR